MGKSGIRIAVTVAAVLTLACIFVLGSATAATEPFAKVSFLEGNAVAKKGATGEWKPVMKGDQLVADHVLKTEKNTKMELTLPDGSLLRVAPLSRVRLKSLIHTGKAASDKGVSFKVEAGKIWANVSKAVGERKFEVGSESAVAGVRGTVFRLDVSDDQATVVKVFSGAVAVTNAPIYQRHAKKEGERVQVQGPQQVTKKEFEELVAKAMQEVRVAADGKMTQGTFTLAESDDWTTWNSERDKLASAPKHEPEEK